MQNYILRFLKEISCVRLRQWCRLAKTGKNNYAVALVFNMQCPDVRRSPRFVFCVLIVPKPYVPHQNSRTKAHSWDVDYPPK